MTRPRLPEGSAGRHAWMCPCGTGVLKVLAPGADDQDLIAFGAMAGSGFLLGVVLLVAFDRRVLWVLGALLQLAVVWGYISVAPSRTPEFEVWGITLRVIQVPLFAALAYLALRGPVQGTARA